MNTGIREARSEYSKIDFLVYYKGMEKDDNKEKLFDFITIRSVFQDGKLWIPTNGGTMVCEDMDYLVRGEDGNCIPMNRKTFEALFKEIR